MTVFPELLVPAGGWEQLEAALLYGADAVYLGGSELNLRAASQGFEGQRLAEAVQLAHRHHARVYYCLNAMPYDRHLAPLEKTLAFLPEAGIDGLIIADPGVLYLARQQCPSIPIHLSTQAHTVNSASIAFWREAGVSRVNLARELGAASLRSILHSCSGMEFEIFVHGAMCLALSGHCLLSAWVNNRPANLGRCTQPCRFEYRGMKLEVEEKKREGETLWQVESGEDFSAFWASHDLCLVRFLPWFAASGVHAVKVEGRTKSAGYVAQVTDVYRTLLDCCRAGHVARSALDAGARALRDVSSRPLSTGFFLPRRRIEPESGGGQPQSVLARLVAPLENHEGWKIDVRAPWGTDTPAELLVPGMRRVALEPGRFGLENHRGEKTERLHPGMTGVVYGIPEGARPGWYIRSGRVDSGMNA